MAFGILPHSLPHGLLPQSNYILLGKTVHIIMDYYTEMVHYRHHNYLLSINEFTNIFRPKRKELGFGTRIAPRLLFLEAGDGPQLFLLSLDLLPVY